MDCMYIGGCFGHAHWDFGNIGRSHQYLTKFIWLCSADRDLSIHGRSSLNDVARRR